MIANTDRVFYVDPVQPVERDRNNTPVSHIIAMKYMRPGHDDMLGKVIPSDHQQLDGAKLWWVDEHGNYVDGAPIRARFTNSSVAFILALLDDGFVVGRSGGMAPHGGHALANPVWSDGRVYNAPYMNNKVVKAAPWALELMPEPGDTQAVVDAKVAIARQRWHQRYKKAEIYREGMRRDWLDYLQEVRDDGHDLPTPQFVVGVDGVFIERTGEARNDELTEAVRERVGNVQSYSVRPDNTQVSHYVGIPFRAVTTLSVTNQQEMLEVPVDAIRSQARQILGVHGEMVANFRFPVLQNF